MIKYTPLLLAYPLGKILAKITKRESKIYSLPQYFPTIKKLLLITIAIAISQNEQTFLASTFMLITTHFWQKTK